MERLKKKIYEAVKPKVMDLIAKGIVKGGFALITKAAGAAGTKLKAAAKEKVKLTLFG